MILHYKQQTYSVSVQVLNIIGARGFSCAVFSRGQVALCCTFSPTTLGAR